MEKNTRCILMAGGGERGGSGAASAAAAWEDVGAVRGELGGGGGGCWGTPSLLGWGTSKAHPPPPLAAGICSWVAPREVVQCSPPPPPL